MSGVHFAATDRWGGVSAAPYAELNLGGAVGDDPAAVKKAEQVALDELDPIHEVSDALDGHRAGAPGHSHHSVSLLQEELGEV